MSRMNWSEVAPEGAKALFSVHHYVTKKTNLPEELILTNYFTVRDGKIASLIVIHNTPSPY